MGVIDAAPTDLVGIEDGLRRQARRGGGIVVLDPLDADAPTDGVVVTTRRAISRVALVATEVAGRFQREGVRHDPMSWMLAPRTLFGGSTAVEACLDRDDCLRGVLLHGLSIGLDADPAEIDALTGDDGPDGDDGDGSIDFSGVRFDEDRYEEGGVCHVGVDPPADGAGEAADAPRLFTATVVSFDGFERVHAFHASLASEPAEIAGRLFMRMGPAMADARIVEGFDPSEPLVNALVSAALCDTLALVAEDPATPLAAGLDLNVEQRFLG